MTRFSKPPQAGAPWSSWAQEHASDGAPARAARALRTAPAPSKAKHRWVDPLLARVVTGAGQRLFGVMARRVNRARPRPAAGPPLSGEALALHRSSLVVDLHADTPSLVRFGMDPFVAHAPPLPRAALVGHLDVPRARLGGLDLQVMGLIAAPRFDRDSFRTVLAQIRAVRAAARRRPDALRCAPPGEAVGVALREARRAGALCATFCLEGAHPLAGRLERLERLAAEGLRALGLVHFSANEAAVPAWGLGRDPDAGLRPFGYTLIEACNAHGILLDLAHLNRKGFLEAVAASQRPVMVSHTGVSGVWPHWRNLDDEQIRAVADRGGCVGIIFARQFLGGDGVDVVVRHLEHVLQVGGAACPALGSDFDGWVTPPAGLPDVTALPRITEALLCRGHPPETIQGILGENALRVIHAATAGPTRSG